ncbi:MAG: hypothetical protein ACE5I3_09310, partial [Phycisphaerae bacterium]
ATDKRELVREPGAADEGELAREKPVKEFVGRVPRPDTISPAPNKSSGQRTRPTHFKPVDSPELDPARLAKELGLLQSSDEDQIAAWVDQALAANEKAVQDAISNPKKLKAARGFLTGQVMKLSGGKADPKIVGSLIEKKLSEIGNA